MEAIIGMGFGKPIGDRFDSNHQPHRLDGLLSRAFALAYSNHRVMQGNPRESCELRGFLAQMLGMPDRPGDFAV